MDTRTNLNNPVSFLKIEFVIQNFPTKKISKCWLNQKKHLRFR